MSAPLRIVRVANTPRPWIAESRTLYERFGRRDALAVADAAVAAGLRAFAADFALRFAADSSVLRSFFVRGERAGIGQRVASRAPIVARSCAKPRTQG